VRRPELGGVFYYAKGMTKSTISWYSNSLNQPTGYGTQSKQVIKRLVKDGHKVAMLSNYGGEGVNSLIETGAGLIPHYSRGMTQYSTDVMPLHHAHWKSENAGLPAFMITLYDVWVLLDNPALDSIPIASWTPIDHQPAPEKVLTWLRKPNVTPIAMSKFGKAMIENAGIESEYIPHAIDTNLFKPTEFLPEGKSGRDFVGGKDKFVVGMNFANKAGGFIHRKAVAENFKDVDAYVDDFKEKLMNKDGSAAAWATPKMLQVTKKFLSGFTPEELGEYFSGKKNIANLKSTVEAIPNGYNHIDKRLKDLLAEPNKVKRAIIPKSGIEWTPELKDKINELSQQVTDGSIDYERYLSVMKEYFDIDFSPMINEWVDANDLGALSEAERKAYKESLQLYAEAQMPAASFTPTFVTANNDMASRYASDQALKGKLAQIGWEREKWEREQKENPTNALINAAMASKDGTFTQDYAGSKANGVPASKIYVDVIGPDGKVIKQWASALKNNVDKNGKVIVPYKSTLTGKVLTADDYANIPAEITYQPTQGRVDKKSGNNYVYSNTGIGYTATDYTDDNGNVRTRLDGLGLQFSMPEVNAVENGSKVESTIKGGNVFFGQTTNVQSEKNKISGGTSSGGVNYE